MILALPGYLAVTREYLVVGLFQVTGSFQECINSLRFLCPCSPFYPK